MTVHLHIVPDARPLVRGDCADGPRPCARIRCRHHLFLDTVTIGGEPTSKFASLEAMTETCSLDVATRGSLTAREIGLLMGISHGRVQQIEEIGMAKMKKRLDADMVDAWSHASEISPNAGAEDVLDADFKARVQAAYERIVPAAERGKNAIRSAKGRST